MAVAKERKEAAAKVFDEMMSDVQVACRTDRSQRTENASAAFRRALHDTPQACKMMNDFVVHGIVPEGSAQVRIQAVDL